MGFVGCASLFAVGTTAEHEWKVVVGDTKAEPLLRNLIMPKSQIKITAVARLAPVESTGKEPVYTLKGRKEILLMDPRSVVIEHNFEFHHVFPQESDNQEIFAESCKQMIDQVLEGVNGCLLAYGQRKGGKTLSIFGGDNCETDGLFSLSLAHILEAQKGSEGMEISMHFVDIAQDRIRDLGRAGLPTFISDDSGDVQRFQHEEVRLEEETGAYGIPSATSFSITSKDEAISILRKGLQFRREQETMLNPIPLAHTFVMLRLQRPGDTAKPVSFIAFGDLARSEKARKDSTAADQINAQHINSVHGSFVSLSRVLEGLSKQTEDKDLIIPFRESKLTALLSKCLNSACSFAIIACITPIPPLFDDTVNVLQYAGKIKSLAQEGVVLNKDMVDEARAKDMRMKKLREDINDLKFQLEQFEFLHGKRLKELAAKLGLDFDLENLSLTDPYSREAVAVRNMREAMEKAETLKKRKEEMEAKLEIQREILAEVKLVAINNQEKQMRELQEYQVQVNQLTSHIQSAQADAIATLPKDETEHAEELQKLLYHGHLLIEEQSAIVNDLYRVMEGRANWGENNTQEREMGRNAVETSNRVNFRTNERDLKVSIQETERSFQDEIRRRSESLQRSELSFKSYCRLKEDTVSRYEAECVRLLQIAQQQNTLIEGIKNGDFNNGIVPVLIPRGHAPPVPDAIRFKQYDIIRDFSGRCREETAAAHTSR